MMVTSKSEFVRPKPFQLFHSHKESLDRLYEWDKKLYEEVKTSAFGCGTTRSACT